MTIAAAVFPVIHKHKGMDCLDCALGRFFLAVSELKNVLKSVPIADRFQVVFQWFLGNRDVLLQYEGRLSKCQGASFMALEL